MYTYPEGGCMDYLKEALQIVDKMCITSGFKY